MKDPSDANFSLDLKRLRRAYDIGVLRPGAVVDKVLERIAAAGDDAVWIYRVPETVLRARAHALEMNGAAATEQPLWGVPFAIKDNIDVAGLPTTAACSDYTYVAEQTAPAVQRLLDAGAVLVGKTNLDQFATGLVGVRSPYGTPRNPFDARYIPGGSSSGSAVAVSAGLVSFALGTDTAGSGRVPAAMTNIVGLKPTRGRISTQAVLPACRTLDCVCVFALNCDDAWQILRVAEGFDKDDPFSRVVPKVMAQPERASRIGVPSPGDLRFFGNADMARLYEEACAVLVKLGCEIVRIDYAPFNEAGAMLYQGPWIGERLAAIEAFFDAQPEAMHPVTREVIANGRRFDAVATFRAMYRLEELRRATESIWQSADVLALPSVGTVYTCGEVAADPHGTNANLGYYTNFVNLLDLCALAVPAGFLEGRLPAGITLIAPAFHDAALADLGARFHRARGLPLGATGLSLPEAGPPSPLEAAPAAEVVRLAVVGSHLSGEPLNYQLLELGAQLERTTRTRPIYRLYALAGGDPPRPGMIRVGVDKGAAIKAEVWLMSAAAFGSFVAQIPSPLAIGTVWLEDGSAVKGFLCENLDLASAQDITRFGDWRAYRAALSREVNSSPS